MRDIIKVKEVFLNHGGIMRTFQLSNEKIYYADISYLVREGYIEKIRNGYYQWIDYDDPNEVAIIVGLFPDGILCMDTAIECLGNGMLLLISIQIVIALKSIIRLSNHILQIPVC